MKKILIVVLEFIIFLIIGGCSAPAILKGAYEGREEPFRHAVMISFNDEDRTFVEYISNVEVDTGTYERIKDNVYKLRSDRQSLEITLNENNTFEVRYNKLNGGKSIVFKNVESVPIYFNPADTDIVEEYRLLIQ